MIDITEQHIALEKSTSKSKTKDNLNAGAILDASVMSESVHQMHSMGNTHFGSIHGDAEIEENANKTAAIGMNQSLTEEKKKVGDDESFVDETGVGNMMAKVKEENRLK